MAESDNPNVPKWDPTSRWIVIINKKPHGPLTREEIRVLLSQGVLRTNDVAFLVRAENASTKRADWKFLWQFDEFDRRRGSITVKEPERRAVAPTPTPDPVHVLPEEYASITPEDLILKTRALPLSDKGADVEVNDQNPPNGVSQSSGRSPWIVGLGLSFAVAIAVFIFRTPSRKGAPIADNSSSRTEAPPRNTLPSRSLLNSGAMRLPTSTQAPQPQVAAPPARPAMPSMKEESGRVRGERGAVPYDPDEEALQAADADEEALAAEEEEAEESAFEDRKPARKKAIKRRRPKAPVREEATDEEAREEEGESEAELE